MKLIFSLLSAAALFNVAVADIAVVPTSSSTKAEAATNLTLKKKHHKKHHKKHSKKSKDAPSASDAAIVQKLGNLADAVEKAKQEKVQHSQEHKINGFVFTTKTLNVNGPLPANFQSVFADSAAAATANGAVKTADGHPVDCGNDYKLTNSKILQHEGNVIVEISVTGRDECMKSIVDQAADPESVLANGQLKQYLVARDPTNAMSTPPDQVSQGIDINTEMPFDELEPFGREDTAHELTEDSIDQSDQMVDQMERAEVAEEKRSVFRALTRLRGAAITSFDGVARSQTGNIDEYNKVHKWRKTHPLQHLAQQESDVTKWAFPAN